MHTARAGAPRAHRPYQVRVFALTWLSYASYYLTRKHFGAVKSTLEEQLGISREMLGWIDTAYLAAYATGQFISGALGDRIGPRRMIGFGMLASAAASWVMGFGSTAIVFLVAYGLNGFFQSTGWPNNVKAVTPWFPRRIRGRIMGFWCTNFQVGGLVATPLATLFLVTIGWRAAFIAPGIWVVLVAVAILVFLVERPQDRGLPPLEKDDSGVAEHACSHCGGDLTGNESGMCPGCGAKIEPAEPKLPILEVLAQPAIWSLSSAYFGLKLIRYSLLFWLPYYLNQGLGYTVGQAGILAVAFEAGGIIGAIVTNWFSDRVAHRRGLLICPMLFGLAGALWLYQLVGGYGWLANAASMALVGFLLFGPDALISGAAAQDLGGTRAAGSAAGVINGFGSMGAVLQGLVTATISERWGWEKLFFVFVGTAIFSACALLPLAVRRAPREENSPAD